MTDQVMEIAHVAFGKVS